MTSTLNLGSKIPMSEVDGLTTAMSNKADTNFANVLGGGVNACFRWLKPDLTRGVSIADGGSMPFDGWAYLWVSTWGVGSALSSANLYINNIRVTGVSTQVGGSGNSASAFVPVKQGDIFKAVLDGPNKVGTCTLYPYEAAPEEEET